MKKIIFLLVVIGIIIGLFSSCRKSLVCEISDAEESRICQMSQEIGITPEEFSEGLLIANIISLEKNVYSAQRADIFIDRIINDVEGFRKAGLKITYLDIVKYVNRISDVLPPNVLAALIIADPESILSDQINLPLTDYDFELILRHLQKQKSIISLYLK